MNKLIWTAKNSNLDRKYHFELSQNKLHAIRYYLSKNKSINEEIKLILSSDPSLTIKTSMARRSDLGIRSTLRLATDNLASIKEVVAYHTKYKKIQLLLTNDNDREVKVSLATNKQLTEDAQLILANACYDIRKWLLRNECLTEKAKEIILFNNLKDSLSRYR